MARGRRRLLVTGLDILATLSLAIPAVIAGFSALLFYLVINRWIPLSGTIWAMAIAYAYRLSVSYRTSHAAVLQIHSDLDDAAAVSGASRLTTFHRIVLPLLLPTVTAAWIQLFILGANEFTLAAFLSTPQSQPLSMYLYQRINPRERPVVRAQPGRRYGADLHHHAHARQLRPQRRRPAATGRPGHHHRPGRRQPVIAGRPAS